MSSKSQLVRPPYILSFVGENENKILTWWTRRILEGCAKRGIASELIDLVEPDWCDRLSQCLAIGDPICCFSFQGFGMGLTIGEQNFWCKSQIPFVSYMGDSPYHAPKLHAAHGPGLYFIYGCDEFFDIYHAGLNGRACASTLNLGFPANPHADNTPWSKRKQNIVFAKTGIDPRELRQDWAKLPRLNRLLLEESAEIVLAGTDATVAEVCSASFDRHRFHCGNQRELYLSVCSTVDRYVRAVRGERMVLALLQQDALIIGNWSHLDCSSARARFCQPVSADKLDAIYADARIVVNTLPAVRHGMHERIVAGLLAKAAIVSDTTPSLTRRLADCPSFAGLNIDCITFKDELGDLLQATLSDDLMPDKVAISAKVAQERFSLDNFVTGLLEVLNIETLRRNVQEHFTFSAA